MLRRKGFTLVEMLAVIVIVAILAALALPNFITPRERALDREARATLGLMRAADRIYRMEVGYYYPNSGNVSTVSLINTDLKLSLPDTASPNWSYSISSPTGTGSATRLGRTWTLNSSALSDEPPDLACTGSCL